LCHCADFTLVKNALAVFDCSRNKDGVYILDADPSIRCNEVCACCAVWSSDDLVPCRRVYPRGCLCC
jgi:hypothetical protein